MNTVADRYFTSAFRTLTAAGAVAALTVSSFFLPAAHAAPTETTSNDIPAKAQNIVDKMSLDQKLGQMIWTHVYGSSATSVTEKQAAKNEEVFGKGITTPAAAVQHWNLGGVLYFNWSDNIGRPANLSEITQLSNGLQEAARSSGAHIPLAITVDQEGGIVARLRGSITDFPGAMALGATRDADLARAQGQVMARELKSVGINVDFAPVVDVNTNPENPVIGIRSVGSEPQLVSDLSVATINGMQEEGVSATAKHFPGHGDTSSDSHTSLPVVNYDKATLEQHLQPFRAAVAAGVDMIMTAHVIVKAIDPDHPATISRAVLTDLLRDSMGYQGIITTDAIDMEGAQLAVMSDEEKTHYQEWKCAGTTSVNGGANTPAEKSEACVDLMKQIRGRVTVQAVAAGSDIVLNTYDVAASVDALKEAITDGTIPQSQIDASVKRIVTWKIQRGIMDREPADAEKISDYVRTPDNMHVASQITSKSVTLVRNHKDVLPLPAGASVLVTGSTYGNPEKLRPRLADYGFKTSFATTKKITPTDEEIAAQVAAADKVDYVIYTSYKAYLNEGQQKAVAALHNTGKPVIVVTTNVPYDSAALPTADAVLNVYGNQDPNHEGAARALAGLISPTGSLPVSVPAVTGLSHSRALPYGYSLSYPSRKVSIKTATAPATEVAPFLDVPKDKQFAGEISWLKEQKITTGWPDGTFRPLDNVSREAFAAFLYRFIDQRANSWDIDLEAPSATSFTDYQDGQFKKEVNKLAELGIINGWPDGTFRPHEPIHRDAIAAMLHRLCTRTANVCSHALGNLQVPEPTTHVFADVPAHMQFAQEIAWLKASAITTGYDDLTFRPLQPVHRDAIAAFLYRLSRNSIS